MSFYKTREWKKTRLAALRRSNYRCARCGADIRGKGKSRVDHIQTLKARPDLAHDLGNLRTLCVSCDAARHHEKGTKGLLARGVNIKKVRRPVDADGFPIE